MKDNYLFSLVDPNLLQTTSTTSTTTTAAPICFTSCLNQTWISSGNRFARWLFDGNFVDQTRTYNLTPSNGVSFTTSGYVGQAAVFTLGSNQFLTGPNIPIQNAGFTVDFWFYITYLNEVIDQSFFGICQWPNWYECLHLTMRRTGAIYNLYLGFFNDDLLGLAPLQLNTWYHAAFVFEFSTRRQSIYLNGILDNTRIASGTLNLGNPNTVVGNIDTLWAQSPNNFFLVSDLSSQLSILYLVSYVCSLFTISMPCF